ncbi:MAG: helix-turn-helix domain-containing protein [Dehalococcoidia bacterium]
MTVDEAAAELGISPRGVRKRLEAGSLAGENVAGRVWLIPRVGVEQAKAQGRLRPGPKPRTGQSPSPPPDL